MTFYMVHMMEFVLIGGSYSSIYHGDYINIIVNFRLQKSFWHLVYKSNKP